MSEKVFAEWLILKSIETQYGELQKLSVKVEEFKTFLDTYDTNWWVNLNLKKSREWKPYIELDTWVPDKNLTKKEDDKFNDGMPDF